MDETETTSGTEPGSNSGNQGGGAPTDAPVVKAEVFTKEQYDTAVAKMRRAAEAEFAKKRDTEWLSSLGVTSIAEAVEKLSKVEQPKAKKSEQEIQVETLTKDFQAKLAEKERLLAEKDKAIQAEAAIRSQEQLRACLLAHVGGTTNPEHALALFGVAPKVSRVIDMVNGKPTVVEDGVPLPHINAEEYVKEVLGKPELAYLRKPTGTAGTITRPANGPKTAPATAITPGRRLSIQEQIDAVVVAGLEHANRANGSGR